MSEQIQKLPNETQGDVSAGRAPQGSWRLIVVALFLNWTVLWISNQPASARWIIDQVVFPTRGLVWPTLVVGTVQVALIVFLAIGVWRRPLKTLGLRAKHIPLGVLFLVLLWGAMQALNLVLWYAFATISDGGIQVAATWDDPIKNAGILIGQLFGNALCEEVFYRAFLVVEFYWLFRRRMASQSKAAFWAIFVSQVLFAVGHVPGRLNQGAYSNLESIVIDQSLLIVFGVIFAWMYLTTGNLFIVVVFHSLTNTPILVFESVKSGPSGSELIFAAALAWLIMASILRKRTGRPPRLVLEDITLRSADS